MTTMFSATTPVPGFENEADSDVGISGTGATTMRSEWIADTLGAEGAYTYRTVLLRTRGGAPLPLPLPLEVRRTHSGVTVANVSSGIFGAGDTLNEAMDDFHDAVLEYRDTLARADELTPAMRTLLARLAALA